MDRSRYLLPYQLDWIRDEAEMKLCEKSRRVGITFASSFRQVRKCATRPKHTQWVSSRDLLTAQELIRDYVSLWCQALNLAATGLAGAPEVIDAKRDVQAYVARFPNGSRIVSLSSTPEAFAGKGGDVFLDELALHEDPERLLAMAIPCTTWGGQVEAVSAHHADGSPGDYWPRLCRQAETGGNPMGWSYHRVDIHDAIGQGLVARINQRSGRRQSEVDFLASLRSKVPSEDAWRSQYLCQPSAAGGALLSYERLQSCEDPGCLRALRQLPASAELYLGMDIGRKHDRSVIWLLERVGDVLWTRDLRVLERCPFSVQLELLSELLRDRRLRRAAIDATGIGAMLAEEAQRLHGRHRVDAVTFTAATKQDLAPRMLRSFQDRGLRIPADPTVREDLHRVEKRVSPAGHIRYEGERDADGHCDRFWALALALYAADAGPGITAGQSLNAAADPWQPPTRRSPYLDEDLPRRRDRCAGY